MGVDYPQEVRLLAEITNAPVDYCYQIYKKNNNNVEAAAIEIFNTQKNQRPPPNAAEIDPDLQKAISLSLQEANTASNALGFSTEDQQLNAAIALSLQDAQARNSSFVNDAFMGEDPQLQEAMLASIQSAGSAAVSVVSTEPTARQRVAGMPVGLKNVGNTCYLNSLLQTYYMMPQIRRHVLEWPADKFADRTDDNTKFMRELQRLFAYLTLSEEKWYDPSQLFKTMVDETGSPVKIGSQEDVSEFNDLFLRLMLNGLSMSPSSEQPSNATSEQNLSTCSSETESERMQVDEVTKPAESRPLKASQGNINTSPFMKEMFRSDAIEMKTIVEESGKETTMEIEFEFGRNFILPVAKHSDTLYRGIDVFLRDVADFKTDEGANAVITKLKWFKRLSRVLMFHINRVGFVDGKQVKINDPFKFNDVIYMDRYLWENRETTTKKREVEQELLKELESVKSQLDSFTNYEGKGVAIDTLLEGTLTYFRRRMESDSQLASTLQPLVGQLQQFLQAESATRVSLEQAKQSLEQKIDSVYSEMTSLPYKLIGVWMHSVEGIEKLINIFFIGSASGGHFWAYIKDFKTEKFLKFNDIHVSEISEEEVFTSGIGGSGSVSAYFLLYMRIDEYNKEVELAKNENLESVIPPALRNEVMQANERFRKQLEDYLKNSDEKRVERFASQLETKIKSAEEMVKTYTPAVDMRVRSYSAWLLSLGFDEHMVVSLINELWVTTFARGLSKDIESTAFKLACEKLPQGEAIMRKALDACLNQEEDKKLREQFRAFQDVFHLFVIGVRHLNNQHFEDALKTLAIAAERNNALEFEKARRPDIINVLKVALMASMETVVDRQSDPSVVSLFDAIVQCCRALIPSEDDPVVIYLRDSYVNEIILKEDADGSPEVREKLTALGESWLEGDTTPFKVKWKVQEPKRYDEVEQWENLVKTSVQTFLAYKFDYEVYIDKLLELDPNATAQPYIGSDAVNKLSTAESNKTDVEKANAPDCGGANIPLPTHSSSNLDSMDLD